MSLTARQKLTLAACLSYCHSNLDDVNEGLEAYDEESWAPRPGVILTAAGEGPPLTEADVAALARLFEVELD
jgi:hypothetical protein